MAFLAFANLKTLQIPKAPLLGGCEISGRFELKSGGKAIPINPSTSWLIRIPWECPEVAPAPQFRSHLPQAPGKQHRNKKNPSFSQSINSSSPAQALNVFSSADLFGLLWETALGSIFSWKIPLAGDHPRPMGKSFSFRIEVVWDFSVMAPLRADLGAPRVLLGG